MHGFRFINKRLLISCDTGIYAIIEVVNTQDEIDLLFTELKVLFIFETIMACTIPIHVTRIDGENAKSKINYIL